MKNRYTANNQVMFMKPGQICNICGTDNSFLAKVCDDCGGRLGPWSEQRSNHRARPIISRLKRKEALVKRIVFFSTIIFAATFFATYLFLNSVKTSHAADRNFVDIPLDHQLYKDCKNLIKLDGCKFDSNRRFEPYAPVSAEDINQALLAITRFNRRELSENLLMGTEHLEPKAVFDHLQMVAEIHGRKNAFREIERSQFADLSKLNILSVIEKVFLGEANEN